jgi:hypothetical protein
MDYVKKIVENALSDKFVGNVAEMKISIEAPMDVYYDTEERRFELESVSYAKIAEEKIYVNGKTAIECELIVAKNDDINLDIDEAGYLVLSGKDKDKYEINEMGELIYKY